MTYCDPIIGEGAAVSALVPTLAPPWQKLPINPLAAPDPARAKAAPGIELPKGTWFDEAYDLHDPEGDALTTAVLAFLPSPKRSDHRANLYCLTRSILANALRCHFHRDPPLVAFTSGAGQPYYQTTPKWLNAEAMRRTIKLLADAGLVTDTTGVWGQASSTYSATAALLELTSQLGIEIDSLMAHRLRPERLVRLYRQKSGNSSPMAFIPTEETEYWTAQLAEYNAFIAGQNIALALSAAEEQQWVARWNAKRHRDREGRAIPRPAVIRPELIQTDLHRCFNNGWNEWFMEGGRLYGGWWINTPGELRKKITINDRSVIEADYSGSQIRLLYLERGIAYRDDPYELEALIAHARASDLPDDHYRDAVKAMMQALINGESKKRLELAPLDDGFSYDPFEPLAVRRMIEEKHTAIADDFGTGVGLHLQRKDSDLALTIIVNLMQQGIVALPVHDSFIVAQEHQEILIGEMEIAYRKMFKGYSPLIDVK